MAKYSHSLLLQALKKKKKSPTHVHMSHTREPTGTGKKCLPLGSTIIRIMMLTDKKMGRNKTRLKTDPYHPQYDV